MLDTYSIHEGVNAERFDAERVLELVPPDGQFALMNYRWVRHSLRNIPQFLHFTKSTFAGLCGAASLRLMARAARFLPGSIPVSA